MVVSDKGVSLRPPFPSVVVVGLDTRSSQADVDRNNMVPAPPSASNLTCRP